MHKLVYRVNGRRVIKQHIHWPHFEITDLALLQVSLMRYEDPIIEEKVNSITLPSVMCVLQSMGTTELD